MLKSGNEMGRNFNAVKDVIRGEGNVQNKFFIIYDAQYLFLSDYKIFEQIFEIFLEVAEEKNKQASNLKLILLLENQEKVSIRRLLRRKEKYNIEVVNVVQHE